MSLPVDKTERISALEFKQRTEKDPNWAKHLDHPVVVYEHVDMRDSNIKYLSRWLRFSGKDRDGESASFVGCKNLENAEGTYDGSVDFSRSGIKTIGRLKVLGRTRFNLNRSNDSFSAYFYRCPNLKTLSGEYGYAVAAAESNIQAIANFKVRSQDVKHKVDLSCNPIKKVGPNVELTPDEILWDEHTDDEAKAIVEKELNKRFQTPNPNHAKIKNSLESQDAQDAQKIQISQEEPTILEESRRTIVRTIAEAIGADDILVQHKEPIESPKRRKLLRASTIMIAALALFIYKTGDEFVKQTVIDPTVRAIRNTPDLIEIGNINKLRFNPDNTAPVNQITNPNQPLGSSINAVETGTWPSEFSPALRKYEESQKTPEDKAILARDTILALGLSPEQVALKMKIKSKLDAQIARELESTYSTYSTYPSSPELKKTQILQAALETLEEFEKDKSNFIKDIPAQNKSDSILTQPPKKDTHQNKSEKQKRRQDNLPSIE